NRLNEGLIEAMSAEPPVTGFVVVVVHGLPEVFLGLFSAEAWAVGMKGDHLAAAIDECEEVVAGYVVDLRSRVLDGDGIGGGHDRAGDGQTREQSDITGQHRLALVAEVLKRGH